MNGYESVQAYIWGLHLHLGHLADALGYFYTKRLQYNKYICHLQLVLSFA